MTQLRTVNSHYGAPMGRHGYGTPETPARLFKVELNSGGYDDGGAYWGLRTRGETLYCLSTEAVWQADIEMETEPSQHFYSAPSRFAAFAMALEQFPDLVLKVPAIDKRYTVTSEFTGAPRSRYVARFNGERIDCFETHQDAIIACAEAYLDRMKS